MAQQLIFTAFSEKGATDLRFTSDKTSHTHTIKAIIDAAEKPTIAYKLFISTHSSKRFYPFSS